MSHVPSGQRGRRLVEPQTALLFLRAVALVAMLLEVRLNLAGKVDRVRSRGNLVSRLGLGDCCPPECRQERDREPTDAIEAANFEGQVHEGPFHGGRVDRATKTVGRDVAGSAPEATTACDQPMVDGLGRLGSYCNVAGQARPTAAQTEGKWGHARDRKLSRNLGNDVRWARG